MCLRENAQTLGQRTGDLQRTLARDTREQWLPRATVFVGRAVTETTCARFSMVGILLRIGKCTPLSDLLGPPIALHPNLSPLGAAPSRMFSRKSSKRVKKPVVLTRRCRRGSQVSPAADLSRESPL